MPVPLLGAAAMSVAICLVLWIDRTGAAAGHGVDLFGTCLITLGAVGFGWLIAGRIVRDPHRRGLIALVFGIWGPLFSTFHVLTVHAGLPAQAPLPAGVAWTAVCALAVWLLSRGRVSFSFATRALGIAAVVLLGAQSIRALQPEPGGERAPQIADRRDSAHPDVYLIVLDKYSSGAWLARSYGLDHAPFEDSLRSLGFAVPRAARANYAHTEMALASFLNWKLFDRQEAGDSELSWDGMRALVDSARVWETFHDRGYRIMMFPTTFRATRSLSAADAHLRPPPARSAPFGATWWVNSPFAAWAPWRCRGAACAMEATPYPVESLEDLEWKLETLRSLPDSAGPVLAFMHLLVPHEPYLFAADCSARAPWWPSTDRGDEFGRIGEAYAAQVTCLDRMLLRTVSDLLARPGPRPVIILQGDHGHGRITIDPLRGFTLSRSELSREELGERFGVFAAYHFPGADTAVYDDISAVNVLPMVLRALFDEKVPAMRDRSLWSSYQDPFNFTEVAASITRPPAGQPR